MSNLSPKETDLLQRVISKVELQPYFFEKAKRLKWFEPLKESGFFDPTTISGPVPSGDTDYVRIPLWHPANYLKNSSSILEAESNQDYASEYLDILIDVTKHAREEELSNYQIWWRFAEILSNLPTDLIGIDHLDVIDYWIDDKYDNGLVIDTIAMKWLPILVADKDEHSQALATRTLEILFKVVERPHLQDQESAFTIRFKDYLINKFVESEAVALGQELKQEAVTIFQSALCTYLHNSNNDKHSFVWHPAIEEHKQNRYRDQAGNWLIKALRESTQGWLDSDPNNATVPISSLLDHEYQTIERIALNAITNNYVLFQDSTDQVLVEKYLNENYRHEVWCFLNQCYAQFSVEQKEKTNSLIGNITRIDKDGSIQEGATAYSRAIWLSAIKDTGDTENNLYQAAVAVAKAEPENPSFAAYLTAGFLPRNSPYSAEELNALPVEELVKTLKHFEDPGDFYAPGLEGLSDVFKQYVKSNPLDTYLSISSFSDLDLAFTHQLVSGYRELWNEKQDLPWTEILSSLFDFVLKVFQQKEFWDEKNAKPRDVFVANRHCVISEISRFVEDGVKSDDHAFDESLNSLAENVLAFILEKESGVEFNLEEDAFHVTIDSPRGHCLQAMITLTLRCSRLEEALDKCHIKTWAHFQHYFDREIERSKENESYYEFITLVTRHILSFFYLSKDWVADNLENIFDKDHYQRWLCAVQGFSSTDRYVTEVYSHLRDNGDLISILDDKHLDERVKEKVIQHIALAYLYDFEKFDESPLKVLLSRNDQIEIMHLIWYFWIVRKDNLENLQSKVYELWPLIQYNLDFEADEGKTIASQLCYWVTFVTELDQDRLKLIRDIAPFSDVVHNSSHLLERIAELSDSQPMEAFEAWNSMLAGSMPDYPKESVVMLLGNILNTGSEGAHKARGIVSKYLEAGNNGPADWLREIEIGRSK